MTSDQEVLQALTEHVEAALADALVAAGRRPVSANKIASLLVPVVVALINDPLVQQAAALDPRKTTDG